MQASATSSVVPEPTPTRSLRQQGIFPPERLAALECIVVGVGAIGRQVALQLNSIGGIGRIRLIDFDTVELVNLGPQGYFHSDIGKSKVEATYSLCRMANADQNIDIINERFSNEIDLDPERSVIFSCVDTMAARQEIWNASRERCQLYIDGRMAVETVRILIKLPCSLMAKLLLLHAQLVLLFLHPILQLA